jgi:hypothetical protein
MHVPGRRQTTFSRSELEDLYVNQSLSQTAIGEVFHVSQSLISQYILKWNIPQRVKWSKWAGNFAMPGDAFQILTPVTAYVLGLAYADGCLREHKKSGRDSWWSLSIKSKDFQIVTDIQSNIGGKIGSPDKRSGCYVWQHGCTSCVNNLFDLGLSKGKTFRLSMPKIPTDLYPHFIRGYFDGDGCVSRGSQGYWRMLFTSASRRLLIDLDSTLQIYAGLRSGKIYDHPTYSSLYYFQHDSAKFAQYIYFNAPIYLRRKYLRFLQIAGWSPCDGVLVTETAFPLAVWAAASQSSQTHPGARGTNPTQSAARVG